MTEYHSSKGEVGMLVTTALTCLAVISPLQIKEFTNKTILMILNLSITNLRFKTRYAYLIKKSIDTTSMARMMMECS